MSRVYLPREEWGPGPWAGEPDTDSFSAHGLECLILRNREPGNLCGYVRLPVLHPLHGVDGSREIDVLRDFVAKRESMPLGDSPGLGVMLGALSGGLDPKINQVLDVHGGVTFTGELRAREGWWVGFDCAHYGDMSPGKAPEWQYGGNVYRDISYVRAQCTKLAEQLASVKIPEVN